MPAAQGVAGIERISGCDHHDGNPVRLLWGCGKLVVDNLAAGGEREAQIAVDDAPEYGPASRTSPDAEQLRQSVHRGRGGEDLGADVGELLDEGRRLSQVGCLVRLIAEEDAFSAGPQSRCEPAHFLRSHLRRGTRTGTVVGNH